MDIEIKKGDYGVSWAIKRQLQNEGVNTKNINSCWTEIMNAFKGDNESKVNNKTIEEQWDTLRANVKVAVGQVITIAEATWNKIKDIVKNAADNSNNDGSINGADENQGSKNLKRNGSDVTVTEDDCRTTDFNGIYYCEKTGKHYKKVNVKMEEIKPVNSNGRITQFFKDGSHTERINESGNNYTIRKYDKNNNFIIQTVYKNGKPYKTSSNPSSEYGFYQKDRYHVYGKNVVKLPQKKLPNGDLVVFIRSDKSGYTGYKRFNSEKEFLYNCDADGNRIE